MHLHVLLWHTCISNMVDVAKQAFNTKNFALAADIYERQITVNGPTVEGYLGLADSYARGKLLSKSFDAYIKAFRLGNINPSKLDNLVTALIDMTSIENVDVVKHQFFDPFSCVDCKGLWTDPVTIPCGHTYCRPCLEKLKDKTCLLCNSKVRYSSNLKSNFLLNKTVETWFPEDICAGKLKVVGNVLFRKRLFQEAVDKYSEAVKIGNFTLFVLSESRCHSGTLTQFNFVLHMNLGVSFVSIYFYSCLKY